MTAAAGYNVINTGGSHVGTDLTGLFGATVYAATVTIDLVNVIPVSALGSANLTYTTLLATINAAIFGFGVAALVGGNIRITSDTTGLSSTVTIVDAGLDPLFFSLTGFVGFIPVPGTATVVTYLYNVGQTVFVVTPPSVLGFNNVSGVQQGVVKIVDINVSLPTPALPKITYTIQYCVAVNGSTVVSESQVFGDIDSALAEYKTEIDAVC